MAGTWSKESPAPSLARHRQGCVVAPILAVPVGAVDLYELAERSTCSINRAAR
jgi:hypothetical protein